MAERRMLSKSITGSDDFLSLGFEARVLYLHLIAEADDDGFVANLKKQIRIVGTDERALSELVESDFLIRFPSGVCAIRHWHVHNRVRRDRYRPTAYQQEWRQLRLERDGIYAVLCADAREAEQSSDAAAEIASGEADFLGSFVTYHATNTDACDVDEIGSDKEADPEKIGEISSGVDEEFEDYYGEFSNENETIPTASEESPADEGSDADDGPSLTVKEIREIFPKLTAWKRVMERTGLPFPILAKYDPLEGVEYVYRLPFLVQEEYRRRIDCIIQYFISAEFVSSAQAFISYNEARCWRGVGGENVMERVYFYADEWEKCERIKRNLPLRVINRPIPEPYYGEKEDEKGDV